MCLSSESQYGLVCKTVFSCGKILLGVYIVENSFFFFPFSFLKPLIAMRYSSVNVWSVWLHKGGYCLGWKLLLAQDFPLKHVRIFPIMHQFGFFLLFQLALVHIQNFLVTLEFFKLFISLEQKEHLNESFKLTLFFKYFKNYTSELRFYKLTFCWELTWTS